MSVLPSARKSRDKKAGMVPNSIVFEIQNTSLVFKARTRTNVPKKLYRLIVEQVTFPLLQNVAKREK